MNSNETPGDPLKASVIETALAGRRVGRRVFCLSEVGSTNDVAVELARGGDADGLVVTAESQNAGRGTSRRRWLSPPGENVMMTVALACGPHAPGDEALVMAAGLAVAAGCERAAGLADGVCRLKWPNDVLLDGGKLAGILIERRATGEGDVSFIGIGINVNSAPDPHDVDRPPACLSNASGATLDRTQVAIAVLQALDDRVTDLDDAPETLADLRARWARRLDSRVRPQ